nr:macrolide family glycosyltransferase [Amycolatopsis antarctica]
MAAPAHGHVNPSLALVRELVGRGHRVTFAINADFAPLVASAGARPVLYESTFPGIDAPDDVWPTDPVAGMRLFFDEFVATLPQIEAAYEDDRPDVVVYDIGGFPAPVLAARWGVRAIQLSPTHVAYEGYDAADSPLAVEESAELAAFEREFEDFVAAQDVGLTAMDVRARPWRCLVALTRSFQLHGDRVGDNYTFVGPGIAAREGDGAWAPAGGRPVLLVSLGSAYNNQPGFYRLAAEAFGGLDWQVVMSIGRFFDPAELGVLPSNVEVHEWVPQRAVLEHASAFVTHAGMGSTMEGLYYGVPLIAVPQAVDQPLNAARIADLGLGVHLPKEEVSVPALREALCTVTADPAIGDRLDAMRREIAAAGGPPAAADIVESCLS